MFVCPRFQLRIQSDAAIHTNDVAFLQLRFDFARKDITKAANSVMIFFNNGVMVVVCCIDACGCECKLSDCVLKYVARLDVMNNPNEGHIVDAFWSK